MLSERIKEIMKEKKIGNKALSEKSGVPLGTLNKIIYGETQDPSVNTIRDIASALDCTLDDLDETGGKYELQGMYFRFAKEAQDLGLDQDDIDTILKQYRKHLERNK